MFSFISKFVHSKATEFQRDDEAATIVTTALMLPILFGFAALAIDGSLLFLNKRELQTIADSGALYGAHETITITDYTDADRPAMTSMVQSGAEESGFNATSDTMEVASPPGAGRYTASLPGDFVEVIVRRNVPYMFAGVLGGAISPTAEARAVAGSVVISQSGGCLIGLAPDGVGTITFSGTTAITVPCGVHSNSDDPRGVRIQGTADVGVTGVSSVGGIRENGTNAEFYYYNPADPDGDFAYNPTANAIEDPFSDIQDLIDIAALSPCTITATGYGQNPNAAVTVGATDPLWETFPSAGTPSYNPGIVICGNLNFTGKTLLRSGTYYVLGSISIGGQAVLRHDRDGDGEPDDLDIRDISNEGVTFVLTSTTPTETGNLSINAQSDVEITAPSDPSGSPYAGMLFVQDDQAPNDANNQSQILGGSNMILDGAIYFPSTHVAVAGGSENDNTCTMIVSYTLDVGGGANINSDMTRCGNLGIDPAGGGVALRRVQLVE